MFTGCMVKQRVFAGSDFVIKLKSNVFGYFYPVNIMFLNEINNDWGDLTNVPAKTPTSASVLDEL